MVRPVSIDHPWVALEHAAGTWPAEDALVFPHQQARLTFRQWHDETLALAGALAARDLHRGDHIALLAENRAEWPVVQMACAALGAVFVPLNTHYRKDDLAYALKQSDAKALICSTSYRSNPYLDNVTALRPQLPLLAHVFTLEQDYPRLVGEAHAFNPAATESAAVAALLYTSGTTGFPKGALLSHRAMMMDAHGAATRLGLVASDRWTSIIPLFHCAGCIMNILGSLQFGATYVGVPSFDAEGMFKVIEDERCTCLSGVPTSYLAMLDHPARKNYDLSSLRAGTCGGADCNPEILRRCAVEFPMPGLCQVYGQTEGATLFSCPRFDDPQRFDTAGEILPGYKIRIVDPQTLAPLPAGTIGEIQARGPMVMEGYYNKPEETAETIVDGWLRSGDLGYLTGDGHLAVAGGRLRDMIIRGAENIYPAEIENVLQGHPAVTEIAVFALKDGYYGETVAAAVKLTGEITAAELRDFCAERIARFKVPATLYRITQFPLTPSGKIRKVELRRLAEEKRLELLP
ncbi:MAG: AMP-binding protein [Rhizobiales bacterium]|nr:AMP-binding protein [Hyphomicrobiales bacterium]MBI3672861.1 AMP-binding protein [Hyphomicrobiales bacterium]